MNMTKTKKIVIALMVIFIYFSIFESLYCNVNADNDVVEEKIEEESLDWIKFKQKEFTATTIPAQYDMRSSNPYGFSNHGNVNALSEAQVGGTCWDYAGMMAFQTTIAKKNNASTYPIFSKSHIDYMATKYSGKKYGGQRDIGEGAGWGTVLGYLKNNDGPILKSKCSYTLYNNDYFNDRVTLNGTSYFCNTEASKRTVIGLMDKITPDYYAHETIEFPGVYVKGPSANGTLGTKKMILASTGREITENEMTEIRNTVKTHVMEKGGVYCSIRTHHYFIGNNLGSPYNTYDGKYSQYDDGSITGEVDGESPGGHAITIIGWDDNYSRSKFNVKNNKGEIVHPTSNGAWLILNNGGQNMWENGCQWVSYEDYSVNNGIAGYLSVSNSVKYYTYAFTSQSAYTKMKSLVSEYGDGATSTDNTKTVRGIDLIFNDMKILNFSSCGITNSDFNVLLGNNLPKLTTLKLGSNSISDISALYTFRDTIETLDLSGNNISNANVLTNLGKLKKLDLEYNKISDVRSLHLSQYDSINLKGQDIKVTLESSDTQYTYPSIITEAKKSSSVLYSKDGLSFSGCTEKPDGTGVILTANRATITINSGDAFGTTITITRPVDNPPTIKMYSSKTGEEIADGATIEKGKSIRFVFSDDNGITGYNRTSSTTAPTTWLTTYDQQPVQNVRIVTKTLETIGQNYIWVKDTAGQTTRVSLNVILPGDVDGNSKINIRDIIKIRKYIASPTKWNLTELEETRADVTGDEKINIRDIIKIRKYIAASSNSSVATKHPDWLW